MRSCMTEGVAYVHHQGDEYYSVHPRHPFVFVHDYLQPIPSAVTAADEGTELVDVLISVTLLLAAITGCLASLWKLQLCEWCWVKTRKMRRRRVSSEAPSEGGYSTSSELPVYRIWGDIWGTKSSQNIEYEEVFSRDNEVVSAAFLSINSMQSSGLDAIPPSLKIDHQRLDIPYGNSLRSRPNVPLQHREDGGEYSSVINMSYYDQVDDLNSGLDLFVTDDSEGDVSNVVENLARSVEMAHSRHKRSPTTHKPISAYTS